MHSVPLRPLRQEKPDWLISLLWPNPIGWQPGSGLKRCASLSDVKVKQALLPEQEPYSLMIQSWIKIQIQYI